MSLPLAFHKTDVEESAVLRKRKPVSANAQVGSSGECLICTTAIRLPLSVGFSR
jgi:hypothetical protein